MNGVSDVNKEACQKQSLPPGLAQVVWICPSVPKCGTAFVVLTKTQTWRVRPFESVMVRELTSAPFVLTVQVPEIVNKEPLAATQELIVAAVVEPSVFWSVAVSVYVELGCAINSRADASSCIGTTGFENVTCCSHDPI